MIVPIHSAGVSPLDWLARSPESPAVYWRGRNDHCEWGGYDVAFEARLKGAHASRTAVRLAAEVLSRCLVIDGPDRLEFPRLFSGFSFDPTRSDDALWADFPDAWILLPKLFCVFSHGVGVWYTVLTVTDSSSAEGVAGLIESAAKTVRAQLARTVGSIAPQFGELKSLDAPEPWNSHVRALTRRMEGEEIRKVVLSRRFECKSSTTPSSWSVSACLRDANPGCFIFGFRPGTQLTFVGASPERLFRLDGSTIESECVAGTIGRGSDSDADESLAHVLLTSRKDNLEHYYVLEDILQALGELCQRMDAGTRPQILKLPTLQHLITTAHGELRKETNLADVLARLHPTPAVGGTPRDAALVAIREMEANSRGWYAGPVGWIGIDSAEFAVAIRSAIISPTGATVFAGAGIVPGSEPEREWRETENKARAFVSALSAQHT